MSYGGRFIDWLRSLTAKTTSIDGTEQIHIDSSGLSQKATLANVIRYGGGSPRNTTAGNATVTQTTDGALYLEVAGQTVGNARGAGAFDWQAVRTGATQVASGAYAFAAGRECTASGTAAVAIGYQITASQANAVGIGSGAASGNSSFFIGINLNVSGYAAGAFGLRSQASADYSYVLGHALLATNSGQLAFGNGIAGENYSGKAQGNLQTFITVTTDATSTPLNTFNTATSRMVIPATRSVAFMGIVQAMCNVSSSSNFIKAWKIEGVITRDGSNTTRLVGTPTITEIAKDTDGTPTPSTWAIASITADDTNEALAINVTGQAGTTIRWQATLLYSQIGF